MEEKLPFYLTYPMQYGELEQKEERIDYEYIQSMYPNLAKKLLPYVEEFCEHLEYEGSMFYDEYPDRLWLHLQGKKLCEQVKKEEKAEGTWLEELIRVMLCQEIYKRRRDRRYYKSMFYSGLNMKTKGNRRE